MTFMPQFNFCPTRPVLWREFSRSLFLAEQIFPIFKKFPMVSNWNTAVPICFVGLKTRNFSEVMLELVSSASAKHNYCSNLNFVEKKVDFVNSVKAEQEKNLLELESEKSEISKRLKQQMEFIKNRREITSLQNDLDKLHQRELHTKKIHEEILREITSCCEQFTTPLAHYAIVETDFARGQKWKFAMEIIAGYDSSGSVVGVGGYRRLLYVY